MLSKLILAAAAVLPAGVAALAWGGGAPAGVPLDRVHRVSVDYVAEAEVPVQAVIAPYVSVYRPYRYVSVYRYAPAYRYAVYRYADYRYADFPYRDYRYADYRVRGYRYGDYRFRDYRYADFPYRDYGYGYGYGYGYRYRYYSPTRAPARDDDGGRAE